MISVQKSILKKELAINLRRKGYTYKEIISRLHIAKSTLSWWIKSSLSPEEEYKIKQKTAIKGKLKIIKINKKRSLKIKKKEREIQEEYAKTIPTFNRENLFWLGMGLYLAEGAKTDRWKAIFYNSDASLNKIMVRFFKDICRVPTANLHVQLVLHENIKEEDAISYWTQVLNIPKRNFYRASYVKSKSSKGVRPKNRLPHGTVQISASGKVYANKVRGWMKGIKRKYAGVVQE